MASTGSNFLLRLAVAMVFLSHGLHGIFTGDDVNDFGHLFLDKTGFAPFGVLIAWIVVLSQVATSVFLLSNKYVKIAAGINIAILLMGIVLVHLKEGWFVVGGGRNGMEFSVVLILVLLTLVFPAGLVNRQAKLSAGETSGRV